MGLYSFKRRPGQTVRLERPAEMDDVLRRDDVHAPQRSESSEIGARLPLMSGPASPSAQPHERRGRQPNIDDELHRAKLIRRAQAALEEEQARAAGSGRR